MDTQSRYERRETHEQFVLRANRVFAGCSGITGSKLERAVFNHLMTKLIDCHGYAGISDTMLYAALEDTVSIVRHYIAHSNDLSTTELHMGRNAFWADDSES